MLSVIVIQVSLTASKNWSASGTYVPVLHTLQHHIILDPNCTNMLNSLVVNPTHFAWNHCLHTLSHCNASSDFRISRLNSEHTTLDLSLSGATFFCYWVRSFMFTMNRIGPSTLPWGTPHEMGFIIMLGCILKMSINLLHNDLFVLCHPHGFSQVF